MFSDTITVTINAVAKVLNRINQDGYTSEYYLRGSLDDFRLKLRNTSYTDKTRGIKVDRHNVELVQTIFPTVAGGIATVRKYYSILEVDATDIVADAAKFGKGVVDFQTEANLIKLLNWES